MKLNINRKQGPVAVNVTPNWLMLLGVVFVLLKVLEVGQVADWSWWLVLLPFYIGLVIILGVIGIIAVIAGLLFGAAAIVDSYDSYKRKHNRKNK